LRAEQHAARLFLDTTDTRSHQDRPGTRAEYLAARLFLDTTDPDHIRIGPAL